MSTTRLHRHSGGTLAVASIAAFMTSIDMMVVTTAIPALRRSLGGGVGALEWTVNAYLLAFACLLLTGAALGDRFGRRRIFCVGLAGFAVSSVAAALAPGIGVLVAARAAQGAAAALVLPLTLTMISEAFPPRARGRAIGIWGGVLGLGGVLGPIMGAAIVQTFGWSFIFWINVPIALALIPAARLLVTETHGDPHRLDIPGVVLESLGFLGICWGLMQATDHQLASSAVLVPIAGGAALVGGFLLWERAAADPMLPSTVFRSTRFNVANAVSFSIYGSLSGAVFLMSQYFQIAQHHDPIAAALRFAPWPLPAVVVAPLAGSLAGKYGNQRFMAAGMVLQGIALAWFAAVAHADTPYAQLWPPLMLSGIGMGMVFPTVSSEIVTSVRPNQMGVAAGANTTIRELGGVFGVALAALVFARPTVYTTPEGFVAGFVPAIWACVALTTLGALTATGALITSARSTTLRAEPPAPIPPAPTDHPVQRGTRNHLDARR